jgi:hypothetical protein
MKDICVQCGLEMQVGQVGVAVIELYMDPPEPYTLTYADTRVCPNCGREVVCPSSAAPTIEHHDAKFTKKVADALQLAEAGKLRIIEVYERANMAPKAECQKCALWSVGNIAYGYCKHPHNIGQMQAWPLFGRLCSYFTPRKGA